MIPPSIMTKKENKMVHSGTCGGCGQMIIRSMEHQCRAEKKANTPAQEKGEKPKPFTRKKR